MDFCVDDGVTSVLSINLSYVLIADTKKFLAKRGCWCHKVMSNSLEVMNNVSFVDRASLDDCYLHKTLSIL